MHKGPDDGIPRDRETHYDRVRNVKAQLEAMQLNFLRVLDEWQKEDGGAVPAPETPVQPTRVKAGMAVTPKLLDQLTHAWQVYTIYGPNAVGEISFLVGHIVEPMLMLWTDAAGKEGWFKERNGNEGED